jgi:uncharacterized RDD family membrane protein YckC
MTNDQRAIDDLYGQYAGFATRLVAWIIDQLIVGVLVGVFGWIVKFVADNFAINELLGLQDYADLLLVSVVALGTVAIGFGYNVGLWLLAGQTPGKQVMGLRIVRTNGQRLTFRSATVRWLGYAISAILFLGYLWVLVDNRRQGFHDKLARTFVVYSWPEKPEWDIAPIQKRQELRRRQRVLGGQSLPKND